jgi:hypothetical protein
LSATQAFYLQNPGFPGPESGGSGRPELLLEADQLRQKWGLISGRMAVSAIFLPE